MMDDRHGKQCQCGHKLACMNRPRVCLPTRQDGMYYAVGRPNWDVGTGPVSCTYMRTNARTGAFLKTKLSYSCIVCINAFIKECGNFS